MFIMFVDPTQPGSSETVSDLYQVGKLYRGMTFLYSVNPKYREKKSSLGIEWDTEPSIGIQSTKAGITMTMPEGVPVTIRNVRKLVESFLHGNYESDKVKYPDQANPHLKSLSSVKHLTKSTYEKHVMDASKDVVVLLYDDTSDDDMQSGII